MGMSFKDFAMDDLSDRQLGELLGNSMSVHVLERILSRALESANLTGHVKCKWENLISAENRVLEMRAQG